MFGRLQVLVIRFKFHQNWLSGFRAVEVRIFPISMCCSL